MWDSELLEGGESGGSEREEESMVSSERGKKAFVNDIYCEFTCYDKGHNEVQCEPPQPHTPHAKRKQIDMERELRFTASSFHTGEKHPEQQQTRRLQRKRGESLKGLAEREGEYYNLLKDPFQLNNQILQVDATRLKTLKHRLKKLKFCKGKEECS